MLDIIVHMHWLVLPSASNRAVHRRRQHEPIPGDCG
jgi:hypothetical protein